MDSPEVPHLRHSETVVPLSRHAAAPLSHAAYTEGDQGLPLLLINLHAFSVDPDRCYYLRAGNPVNHSYITDERITRAVELALDNNETRRAIMATGDRLRLYRNGGSVARQYLDQLF